MSSTSSSPALSQRPRNKKLSAYYNLPHSQQPSAPTSSTSIPPLPNTADRATALAHATNLTKILSLSSLLSHTTDLRKTATTLDISLSTTTHNHYEHLQSAYQVSKSAKEFSQHLLETVSSQTKQYVSTLSSISEQLAPTRDALSKLEASSTLTRLIQAANILSKSLPQLYADLELCTDPTSAQQKLLIAARRTYAVRNAINKIIQETKTDHSELLSAHESLLNSIKSVCASLHESLVSPAEDIIHDQDALPPHLASTVLLLLGEQSAKVRSAYLQASSSSILSSTPNLQVSLYPAAVSVSYATKERLPAVVKVTQHYTQIFKNVNDKCDDLTVWLVDIAHDSITTPVRNILNQQKASKTKNEKEDAEKALNHALIELKHVCTTLKDSLAAQIFLETAEHVMEERAGAARAAAMASCEEAAENVIKQMNGMEIWKKLEKDVEGTMEISEALQRVMYIIGEKEDVLGLAHVKELIDIARKKEIKIEFDDDVLEKRILSIVVAGVSEGIEKEDDEIIINKVRQGLLASKIGKFKSLKGGDVDDLIVNEGLPTLIRRAWLEITRRKQLKDSESANRTMINGMVVIKLLGMESMIEDIERCIMECCVVDTNSLMSKQQATIQAQQIINQHENESVGINLGR